MNFRDICITFPSQAACIAYLEKARWDGRPICPYCKSTRTTSLPKERRHRCNKCGTNFSVTVNTVFHHTHMPLQKWFLAVTLMLNARDGISARKLAKELEINKNTAWFVATRIRNAMMRADERAILQGLAELFV